MGPPSSLHHRGGSSPPWLCPAGPALFCFGVQEMPALGAEAMGRRVCRFLLRGGRFWLCRNHRSLQHGLGSAVLGWRGHTRLGLGGDRRPGHCAGTDLCPSPGAAAQGGKWVSPAGGITPKCPKIPFPVEGGRGGALNTSPAPEWPRARKG